MKTTVQTQNNSTTDQSQPLRAANPLQQQPLLVTGNPFQLVAAEELLQPRFNPLQCFTKAPHQLITGAIIQGKFVTDLPATDGQLTKASFLQLLQQNIYVTANEVLAQINQTAASCPYILRWFTYYNSKDAAHIEQAIHLFAPASDQATNTDEYISAITTRVKQALESHVATGTTDDVPAEILIEKHQPDDFLHIAAAKDIVQRAQFCGGNQGQQGQPAQQQAPPAQQQVLPPTHEQIFNTGTIISNTYPTVKKYQDANGNARIIKYCSAIEIGHLQRMSGIAHFPTYYSSQGLYVITAFIGAYPNTAPHTNGIHDLQQAADFCYEMARRGLQHNDLDNNILNDNGQLYVIDFGISPIVTPAAALTENVRRLKLCLGNDQQKADFDRLIQLKPPL
jgi:hypothetical protein